MKVCVMSSKTVWIKTRKSAIMKICPIKYQQVNHHNSHEAVQHKVVFNFSFTCKPTYFCMMCHSEPPFCHTHQFSQISHWLNLICHTNGAITCGRFLDCTTDKVVVFVCNSEFQARPKGNNIITTINTSSWEQHTHTTTSSLVQPSNLPSPLHTS